MLYFCDRFLGIFQKWGNIMPTRSDYNVIAFGLRQRLSNAMMLLETLKGEKNIDDALHELKKMDEYLENMENQK